MDSNIKNLKLYIIDAFADKLFHGNPAAVCPLDEWLSDNLMQKIAAENNLSETAFFVPVSNPDNRLNNTYQIRWFTPNKEVDLCGHATLASSYIVFNYINKNINNIIFKSNSGDLVINKSDNNLLSMDFPALSYTEIDYPEILIQAIETDNLKFSDKSNIRAVQTYKSKFDLLVILDNIDLLLNLRPDLDKLAKLDYRGIIFTAHNTDSKSPSIHSRCFYPRYNVPEDPVTGSAHCVIAPYWCERLEVSKINARQGLARQGELQCEINRDRVILHGHCQLYSKSDIFLPNS